MRRKALARSAVSSRPARTADGVVAKLADVLHDHGCRTCRRTIGCSCSTPASNPECRPCRGLELSVYDRTREPRDCCWDACQVVTDPDQIALYLLAGPGPWFRCPTCARHHAKNPLTCSRESS